MPSVIKVENGYIMIYTKGNSDGKDYFPGLAFSIDEFGKLDPP